MDMEDFDYNHFANSLQKARNYANNYKYRCCCPNCEKDAEKSHLLQKHPVLNSIADDKNKLLQFEDNWEDARSGRIDLYSLKLDKGINDAMQYPLFCNTHDTSLFLDLEKHNSVPNSKRECLLLAYRAACSVKHQEERRLLLYQYQETHESKEITAAYLKNSQAFVSRMNAVIENLWKAIEGEDNSYIFRMIAMPHFPVAASDCIVDENDFQIHIMDDDYHEPHNCYFVNLIPENDRLLLILGCDTRYDKNGEYENIIKNFPVDCDLQYPHIIETIWGILLKCHNWCCSPKLLDEPQWKKFFEDYERMKINDILK